MSEIASSLRPAPICSDILQTERAGHRANACYRLHHYIPSGLDLALLSPSSARWTRASGVAGAQEEIKPIIINHIFRLRVREDALANAGDRLRGPVDGHTHWLAEQGLAEVAVVTEQGLEALSNAVERRTLGLLR